MAILATAWITNRLIQKWFPHLRARQCCRAKFTPSLICV
jgi:hypothetical protein